MKNDYMDNGQLQETHNQKERKYHFKLGLRTFIKYPFLFVLFVPVILLGVFLWTSPFAYVEDMPEFYNVFWFYFQKVFSVLIPALLSLAIVSGVGNARARKDEALVLEVFYIKHKKELISGHPILVRKNKKKDGTIERTFYTRIHSEVWKELESAIYEKLTEHSVEKLIIIDSPEDDCGYWVKLKTAKNLFAKDKGDIYDDSFEELILGYDLDTWQAYGNKKAIAMNLSGNVAASTLVVGMSGSGKSESIKCLLARLSKQQDSVIFFGDFKQDDTFSFLRDCPRYYPFYQTEEALDKVYEIMHNRQLGEDTTRNPIVFIWDEYMANILALLSTDKKRAENIMRKVSEILMLGRSMKVFLITSMQRCDATAFPAGSRLNYGNVIILGAPIKSIYEMLLSKEQIDRIGDRVFKVGEGVALLQGVDLRFIKMPRVNDEQRMKDLCIDALTRTIPEGADGEAVESPRRLVLPDVNTHASKPDDIRL
ncbi:MAG: type IV secretory system conjugative DNA transfer family protein [Saccharofermentans sp.]|nr:type IV secretory system conjugative DNA transfer family protein [Saccharofermentans sp.]